jgi:hypothetical protein
VNQKREGYFDVDLIVAAVDVICEYRNTGEHELNEDEGD